MKPINGAVYSPHWMEVAILIGVVATAVLAYSLVAHYFPLFDETVVVAPTLTSEQKASRHLAHPEGTGY
jgi:Ni/Fe-hydrogenase subunit HybB-like protein